MKSLTISLLFFLSISMGCNAPSTSKSASSSDESTEWTIFIYGHADNSLTPNMLLDYQEMIAATLSSKVKVVLAVDVDSSVFGGSGTQVYEILGSGQSKIIETFAEEDFDDPNVLTTHMVNAFTKYPSKKRGVILWDHGGSWDGGFGGDNQNGTVPGPVSMSIYQVKSALSAAASNLQLGSTPFDFVSFDTCLMGSIEAVSEFSSIAKYYFGSAEIDFASGWDYKNALNVFSSNPTASIGQIAPAIVQTWDDHHKIAGVMDENLRTQVAIDLSQIDSFSLQINSLISNNLSASFFDVAKSLDRSSPGYGIASEGSSFITSQSYRDIGQFLSLLSNSADVDTSSEATGVFQSLSTALIKAQSLGDVRSGAQVGLSIESRTGSLWTAKQADYSLLAWEAQTSWSSVLGGVTTMAASDGTGPILTTTATNATNPNAVNLPTIEFATSDLDVNKAQVTIKRVLSGAEYSLGVLGFGFVDNLESYRFSWDGKIPTISNGAQTSLVGLSLQGSPGLDANGNVLALGFKIEGLLTDGSTTLQAFLVGYESPFNTIIIIENNQYRTKKISDLNELGLSFVPLIKTSVFPYFAAMTAIELTSSVTGLDLNNTSAPAGSYKIETSLSDIWGNSSTDGDSVTVVTPF